MSKHATLVTYMVEAMHIYYYVDGFVCVCKDKGCREEEQNYRVLGLLIC